MTPSEKTTQDGMVLAFERHHLAAEMRRLHGELLSPEEAAAIATTRHDFEAWTRRLFAEVADWQAAGIARAEALFAKDDARKIAIAQERG